MIDWDAAPQDAGNPVPLCSGPTPAQAASLHSQEALAEMAQLLELVSYWRTEAERLREEYKELRRHVESVLG